MIYRNKLRLHTTLQAKGTTYWQDESRGGSLFLGLSPTIVAKSRGMGTKSPKSPLEVTDLQEKIAKQCRSAARTQFHVQRSTNSGLPVFGLSMFLFRNIRNMISCFNTSILTLFLFLASQVEMPRRSCPHANGRPGQSKSSTAHAGLALAG